MYQQRQSRESESPNECDKANEYRDGTNSITILSEVLSPGAAPSQLVQEGGNDPNAMVDQDWWLIGVDDIDTEYLSRKGAFTFPPQDIW